MADYLTEDGWRALSWAEARTHLGMSEEKANELAAAGWQPVDLLWAPSEGLAELHLATLSRARISAAAAAVKSSAGRGGPNDYDVYKQAVAAVKAFSGDQKDLQRFIYDIEMNVKVGSSIGGIRVRVATNRMEGDAKNWLLMKEKRNERFDETDSGWVRMKGEMNDLWAYIDQEQDALDALAELNWDPKDVEVSTFAVRFLSHLLAGGIVDEETQIKILKTKIGAKARRYLKQKNPASSWAETIKALKEFEASLDKKPVIGAIDQGDGRNKDHVQCFYCKGYGHYSSSCPKKRDTSDAKRANQSRRKGNDGKECFRCGKEGHLSYNCTAPSPKPRDFKQLMAALAVLEEYKKSVDIPAIKNDSCYSSGGGTEITGHDAVRNEGFLSGISEPRIAIQVEGLMTEALIDTGACVSVIECQLIQKMSGIRRGTEKGKCLRTADGSEFQMESDASLKIRVGNEMITWTFQVSPKPLPAPVIIGWDMIRTYDMRLLPQQGLLRVEAEDMALKSKEKGLIRCRRSVTIPAGVTVAVAYETRRNENGRSQWVIDEVDNIQRIVVLRGVHNRDDPLLVLVHNTSDEPFLLEKGRVIGSISDVPQQLLAPIMEANDRYNETIRLPVMNRSGGWEGRPSFEFIQYDPSLAVESRQKLQEFVKNEAREVFEETISGVSNLAAMPIDLVNEGENVVWRPGMRVPYKWRPFVEEKLIALGKIGAIRTSTSNFSAPVLVVPKAGGGLRMVIDYRGLNLKTKTVHGMIPSPEDLFLKMRGCKFISVFDSTDGYHQQRLREGDSHKTAFTCHVGQFEYTRVPQGLKNAPRYYNQAMSTMLAEMGEFCNVYFDDICVFSKTIDEHLIHLKKLFDVLGNNHVSLKGSKSKIGWKRVKYLGHIVSGKGIQMDPEKRRSIQEYPLPVKVDELCRFISMAGYYRKFIYRFSEYEAELRALMKKHKKILEWDEHSKSTFENLKLELQNQMLIHPDWQGKFTVKVDSSEKGWGAILLQDERVVEYASGTFSPAERRYGPCEREALGVILSLERWKNYLLGGRVDLLCDCRALKWLAESQNSSSKLWRWSMRLTEFDVNIIHVPGRNMEDVDALSRAPLDEVHDDPTDIALLDEWKTKILKEAHDGLFSGHPGTNAMIDLMNSSGVSWAGWRKDVKNYVRSCAKCQLSKAKHSREKIRGVYGAMESASSPFKRIWIDIVPVGKELVGIGDNVNPSGCRYILVIVDDHSKWLELIPLRRSNVESMAEAILTRWIVTYGIPEEIVSDATNILDGKEANKLWKSYGIQKIRISPYHQSSNGMVERAIGTVVNVIRCWIGKEKRRWVELLPLVAAVMRNRVGKKSGKSPYEIIFGRKMVTALDVILGQIYKSQMKKLKDISRKYEMPDDQQARIPVTSVKAVKASDKAVFEANQKSKRGEPGKEWKRGDKVFYRNERPLNKFSARWLGPKRIVKVVSKHLFDLEGNIRRHSQQLRRADGGAMEVDKEKEPNEKNYEVEKIVAHGWDDDNELMYLVKWRGHSDKENTWEYETQFDQLKILNDYRRKNGLT
jgi:hypothetical protein